MAVTVAIIFKSEYLTPNNTKDMEREIKPLPHKNIEYSDWIRKEHPEYILRWERVLFFDPTEIYKRIDRLINPYERIHSIEVDKMFPSIDGLCSCGCGAALPKGKRRWASEDCSSFAWDVRSIICNAHQRPTFYIKTYFGSLCADCNENEGEELDHILGVKHGGGGCWLNNFKWRCKKCHRQKTNNDFGFKKSHKFSNQLNLTT